MWTGLTTSTSSGDRLLGRVRSVIAHRLARQAGPLATQLKTDSCGWLRIPEGCQKGGSRWGGIASVNAAIPSGWVELGDCHPVARCVSCFCWI